MVLEADDAELENLVNELSSMLSQQKSPAQAVSGYQAPIKGAFYNSGGFTPSAATPNHPSGHAGIDMRASAGTAIYPMAPGVVTRVGTDPKGGNVVNITHANNVKTYYAHMGSVSVQNGQHVDNDTVIGTVGNSGNAKNTWPHLHLQVWSGGQLQDPAKFFTIPKYTNVDKAKEKFWLSDEAKQEAQAFNMKRHVQSKPAVASRFDPLEKRAQDYYDLAIVLK
jgi:murein DD-endopeptidase MepM/ murein hydrolase activator NlpD